MDEIALLTGLRAGIGAGTWLAPRLAGRMFGLDPEANPQLPYLGRLFGIRDVALAVGLQMSSGESRRLWLRLGVLCDAADTAAGLIAGRNKEIPALTTALVTAPALLGVKLGVSALKATEAQDA